MEMLPIHDAPPQSRRKHERSNTFVAASLVHDDGTLRVRIRNISANGALVSGPDLPPRGTRCALLRGEKRVTGIITRLEGDQAGFAFVREIDVYGWLAAGHLRNVDGSGGGLATRRQPAEGTDALTLASRVDKLLRRLVREACLTPDQLRDLAVLQEVSERLRAAR